MTRKEKEKVLLEGLGLKVGDKIRLISCGKKPYEVKEKDDAFYLYRDNDFSVHTMDILLTEEFEKYVRPKKYKDMICMDLGATCSSCPLTHICSCNLDIVHTVQEQLNEIELDDDEREFYQKRIDKDCKEE